MKKLRSLWLESQNFINKPLGKTRSSTRRGATRVAKRRHKKSARPMGKLDVRRDRHRIEKVRPRQKQVNNTRVTRSMAKPKKPANTTRVTRSMAKHAKKPRPREKPLYGKEGERTD